MPHVDRGVLVRIQPITVQVVDRCADAVIEIDADRAGRRVEQGIR